ncbi:hypothetical protein JCM8097_007693 [Rhodosporidiobolus ruineniae]
MAPPLPPAAASLPLPVAYFGSTSLRLLDWNQHAARLFDLPYTPNQAPPLSADDLLSKGDDGDADVKSSLERWVRQTSELGWGESVVVEYGSKEDSGAGPPVKRAEVLVSFTPPPADDPQAEGIYSILFVRPAAPSLASLLPLTLPSDTASIASPATSVSATSSFEPSYAPVFSPASSTSSLLPAHTSAVFSSASPPAVHASTLANAGLVRTAAAVSSASGSSGGSSSASSSSRRAQRTLTGHDRRNLPVPPDVAQMLAHATNSIKAPTTLSPVPSSPGSADGSAVSSPPPPHSTTPSNLSVPSPTLSTATTASSTSLPLQPPSGLPSRTADFATRRSSFDTRYNKLMDSVNESHANPSGSLYRLADSEEEARSARSGTASPNASPAESAVPPSLAMPAEPPVTPASSTFPPLPSPSVPETAPPATAPPFSPPPPETSWSRPIVREAAELLSGKRRSRLGDGAFSSQDEGEEADPGWPPSSLKSPQRSPERAAVPLPSPSEADEDARAELQMEREEDSAVEEDEGEGETPPPVPAKDASPDEAIAKEDEGAQKRLPLSFDQMTKAVETVPQILFIADPDGRVLWLNKSWYTYTGQDPTYALDEQSWLRCFHPDDLPSAFACYLGAMKTGKDFWFEYRIKAANGDLRWHVCAGRAYKDPETGVIEHWYCTITDTEELVTTRHDALLIKERTQAVLEGSDLFLLTVDTSGRITFCEGRRPSCLPEGRDPGAPIVGSVFEELWPDQELNDGVRKVLDEEQDTVEVETTQIDEDGSEHHHRYRLVPLRGDPSIPSSHPDAIAVTGVIIVGRDVTELVLAETEVARSRAEKAQLEASEFAAREASRLKTEFLTTVSHEIRTPIASILGIMELLIADDITPEQKELVEKAVRSGENLLDLVGAVLDVRKVETGELVLEAAPFLLSEALSDARLFSVIAQKKGLTFVEEIGSPLYEGTLLADRLRLQQILNNALANAIKFTHQGSITFRLHQVAESESTVTVEFVVEDTGVGIAPEVLPTLFVPFRQADASTARRYGGSGLGLTIAKKLVELMSGTVTLTSPGAHLGTRMTIRVPLQKAPLLDVRDFVGTPHPVRPSSQQQAEDLRLKDESVEEVRKRRRPEEVRILLAEDNELIREIVVRTLRGRKFQIDAVEDGGQCLEQVEKQHYDVVLMDGQMPHLDGYEATRAIRAHADPRIRNLRIIALTASAIAGDRERCLKSGMSSYLAKPVRAKELEAAIWQQVELAERNSPADETIAATHPGSSPSIPSLA